MAAGARTSNVGHDGEAWRVPLGTWRGLGWDCGRRLQTLEWKSLRCPGLSGLCVAEPTGTWCPAALLRFLLLCGSECRPRRREGAHPHRSAGSPRRRGRERAPGPRPPPLGGSDAVTRDWAGLTPVVSPWRPRGRFSRLLWHSAHTCLSRCLLQAGGDSGCRGAAGVLDWHVEGCSWGAGLETGAAGNQPCAWPAELLGDE